jgi:glucose-fructose oxidoreductase
LLCLFRLFAAILPGMTRCKVVGINFDHFHMGDLLRYASECPDVELVGICDEQPGRMEEATRNFGFRPDQIFTDADECLDKTQPDLAILCPSAATHGVWTERVAAHGVHILMEKPFAGSLAEADAMAAAVARTGKLLAINWPLRWMPVSITTKRLIDEGIIGEVLNVYHHGGNRGPLYHGADKQERVPTTEDKAASWFYHRAQGGGSLLDYAGYGTTLGTWYNGGKKPIEVTCLTAGDPALEVDEHSIIVARYATGLSKFETRWGTFTDPWVLQPQPKTGFVLCGTEGTIAAWDYEQAVRVQTRARPEGFEVPMDTPAAPYRNPIEYMVHCIQSGEPITGPLSIETSRIGQQIVDTALLSAREGRVMKLVG